MELGNELIQHSGEPGRSSASASAKVWCGLARQLEEVGDYAGARAALGEVWRRVGERPVLDGLDQETSAEVLLRAGVLTGWVGSVEQREGAQEESKNLISEGLAIFERLGMDERVAEAQTELAYCYWRQGAFDEARVVLREALSKLADGDEHLRAVALLRSALVETSATRYSDALRILSGAAALFEASDREVLKGKFHNELAFVLRNLSATERREDYLDRALVEYTAASFHFEQAGHARYQACVENNLGFLFHTVGRFTDAHAHLDRARALFGGLRDGVHLAQVDDTRARVLLSEGRDAEAEQHARAAVRALEKGGEQSLLAEALVTHGVALARTERQQVARLTLQRAVEVAGQAGDAEGAGKAALTILEELWPHLPTEDLCATYERAAELLDDSRDTATLKRLGASARRLLFLTGARQAPPGWEGFSFKHAVRRYEAHLLELALRDSGGVVTRAAQLLGFRHYQTLVALLNKRHSELLHARKPVIPRRRTAGGSADAAVVCAAAKILHVEDSQVIADSVKELLEAEGWEVEGCAEGPGALGRIEGGGAYDLLLLDNEVPGLSGIELARRARRLPHRRRTPIVMLSASDCEAEARRAGVDEFLRKPTDVLRVAETIARLLDGGRGSRPRSGRAGGGRRPGPHPGGR